MLYTRGYMLYDVRIHDNLFRATSCSIHVDTCSIREDTWLSFSIQKFYSYQTTSKVQNDGPCSIYEAQQVSARKKLKKIATKKFKQIWVLIALLDSLGQKTKNFDDVFQRKVVSKWSKNDLSSELFFSEFFHWTPPIFLKNLKALETSFSKLVLHAQKV